MASFKPALFGSVSTATLRTADLLEAFAEELQWQIQRNGEHFSMPENRAERDRLNALAEEAYDLLGIDPDEWTEEQTETADALVNEELMDALQKFAPDYAYFGAHEGDGADFGYWLSGDFECSFGGLRVDDTSEVPEGYSGEVLHVNDHGNMTLYVAVNGELREIWGLV